MTEAKINHEDVPDGLVLKFMECSFRLFGNDTVADLISHRPLTKNWPSLQRLSEKERNAVRLCDVFTVEEFSSQLNHHRIIEPDIINDYGITDFYKGIIEKVMSGNVQ